ncbi:IPT/TIG domain-containing protein [bacterium]|nr:IPT/TIG domain-containing protein [bacterium]
MKSIIKTGLIFAFLLLVVAGCEYDGPVSQWDLVGEETDSPVITEVVPAAAVPGANFLTIVGDHFTDNQENVSVYINGYQAEIVDFSRSSIRIRRPDRSGDSLAIRVNVFGAVNLAKWEPYIISPVYESYGGFISGTALGCLAVGQDEHVYVVENSTAHDIFEVPPDGERQLLGQAPYAIQGGAVRSDGKLVLFANRKDIYDVGSDSVTVYATVDKNVYTGAFDSYGNLYTSGRRTDINIVLSDLSIKKANLYANDEVFCIRIEDDAFYALVQLRSPDESHPEIAVWRHPILDDQANLGDAELIFDWALAGEAYAETVPETFTMDSEGGIYIGSDNVSPILYYNPATGGVDEIYKGIVPSSAAKLVWGSGNYLYMIYSSDASEDDLLRIDMGNPQDRDF